MSYKSTRLYQLARENPTLLLCSAAHGPASARAHTKSPQNNVLNAVNAGNEKTKAVEKIYIYTILCIIYFARHIRQEKH